MPSLDFESEKSSFRSYYNDTAHRLEQTKSAFITLIDSLLTHGQISVASISGRIKDREESIKKFTRKYQTKLEKEQTPYEIKDHITDLIGLRLVCLYEDEIASIGDLLRSHFDVIDVTDKSAELETTENSFGYKGLHLDLKLSNVRSEMPEYVIFAPYRFELQIRTIVQDSWSTLDHKIKYKKSIPASLKRRINTLAALFELADREFREIRDLTEQQIEQAKDEPEPEVQEGELVDPSHQGNIINHLASTLPENYNRLDAFRLLRIAKHYFPGIEFSPEQIDGFTTEVIRNQPGISRGKFNYYLASKIGYVRRYRDNFLSSGKGENFNAFTEMRHTLYIANPEAFASMLTNDARMSFDAWRESNPIHQVG